jgi:pimeloyl-ACP methyl ester carboxylesterase
MPQNGKVKIINNDRGKMRTLKTIGKIGGMVLLVLLAVLLVGPYLVAVPPLEGVVDPEMLADPESKFIQLSGVKVHYKKAGQGENAFVLLHGFAASLYSWREVIPALAQRGMVAAFDRPAFGLTERPTTWNGENPYRAQTAAQMTIELMDELGIQKSILVGNSAGGSIALLTALEYPERVKALILVDAAVYSEISQPWLLKLLMNTPQANRVGPLFVRQIKNWGIDFGKSAWHDPSQISDVIWEGYTQPLKAKDWDRALWEFTRAAEPLNLASRLAEIKIPVLVITGDDDRIVPTEQSIRLADEIQGAELVVIPHCGHVPQEECPQAFLEAVDRFIQNLQ